MTLPDGTREKSVMLVKAMGWEMVEATDQTFEWIVYDAEGVKIGSRLIISLDTPWPDLYAPENMALAWRVLQWAMSCETFEVCNSFVTWWYREESITLAMMSPAEAQAAWLDKILELAIEAGLVEATS